MLPFMNPGLYVRWLARVAERRQAVREHLEWLNSNLGKDHVEVFVPCEWKRRFDALIQERYSK